MLMLSGQKDELVPPSHMRELRRIREGQSVSGEKGEGDKKGAGRVRWREYPLGGHNDTCLIPDYWKDIGEWIRKEVEGKDGEKSGLE